MNIILLFCSVAIFVASLLCIVVVFRGARHNELVSLHINAIAETFLFCIILAALALVALVNFGFLMFLKMLFALLFVVAISPILSSSLAFVIARKGV